MRFEKRICCWCFSSKWMTEKKNCRRAFINWNNPLWKCNECQARDKRLYDKKWKGFNFIIYKSPLNPNYV